MKSPARSPKRSSPNTKKRNTGKNNINLNFKTILVNFSQLAFGEFSSKAFGFLTTLYLARVLGAEGFGEYSWVMAMYTYLFLLGNFGFDTYGIRTIATRPLYEVINGILFLRSIYVSILLVLVLLLNVLILPEPNYLLMLQSASMSLLPFNSQYIFRGLNKAKYDGTYRIAQAVLFFALVYLLITPGRVLIVPVLWFAAAGIVSLFFFLLMARMFSYAFFFPSYTAVKAIVRETLPIGIAGALILFYMNFDTLVLGFYVDNRSVGLYSAAFKIYNFGYTLLALFYITFLPSLSKSYANRSTVTIKNYILTLLASAAVIVVAGPFVSQFLIILSFGNTFIESIPVLKILMLSLAAGCVNFAYMNPLQAIGKDRLFIQLLLLRTGLFIMLCFSLIPSYGIIGAAYSTLIAELITIPCSAFTSKKFS